MQACGRNGPFLGVKLYLGVKPYLSLVAIGCMHVRLDAMAAISFLVLVLVLVLLPCTTTMCLTACCLAVPWRTGLPSVLGLAAAAATGAARQRTASRSWRTR